MDLVMFFSLITIVVSFMSLVWFVSNYLKNKDESKFYFICIFFFVIIVLALSIIQRNIIQTNNYELFGLTVNCEVTAKLITIFSTVMNFFAILFTKSMLFKKFNWIIVLLLIVSSFSLIYLFSPIYCGYLNDNFYITVPFETSPIIKTVIFLAYFVSYGSISYLFFKVGMNIKSLKKRSLYSAVAFLILAIAVSLDISQILIEFKLVYRILQVIGIILFFISFTLIK